MSCTFRIGEILMSFSVFGVFSDLILLQHHRPEEIRKIHRIWKGIDVDGNKLFSKRDIGFRKDLCKKLVIADVYVSLSSIAVVILNSNSVLRKIYEQETEKLYAKISRNNAPHLLSDETFTIPDYHQNDITLNVIPCFWAPEESYNKGFFIEDGKNKNHFFVFSRKSSNATAKLFGCNERERTDSMFLAEDNMYVVCDESAQDYLEEKFMKSGFLENNSVKLSNLSDLTKFRMCSGVHKLSIRASSSGNLKFNTIRGNQYDRETTFKVKFRNGSVRLYSQNLMECVVNEEVPFYITADREQPTCHLFMLRRDPDSKDEDLYVPKMAVSCMWQDWLF